MAVKKMDNEIYSEMILECYRNPKNFGTLSNPDISFKDYNPSCGDVIQIDLKINNNQICDACFSGSGCAISRVCADLILSHIKEKGINDIKDIKNSDVINMLGIELSPMRLKCALLPLKVLKFGVYNYLGENIKEDIYG